MYVKHYIRCLFPYPSFFIHLDLYMFSTDYNDITTYCKSVPTPNISHVVVTTVFVRCSSCSELCLLQLPFNVMSDK